MTTPLQPSDDDTALGTAVEGAQGLLGRVLWVVGTILAVVGAVTTISDLLQHHHGIGPYLLAGAFFLLFLATLDMWRVQRSRSNRVGGQVTRLERDVSRLQDDVQHMRHERDEWQRMHAESEADLRRAQSPQVSGGQYHVASTTELISTTSGTATGYEQRRLPGWPDYEQPHPRNQPPLFGPSQPDLFDQDDPG